MIDIDLRAVWRLAALQLRVWFAASMLVGSLFFVRRTKRLGVFSSTALAFGMTAASWLTVAEFPLAFLAVGIAQQVAFGGKTHLAVWIAGVLMSACVGEGAAASALVLCGQRVTKSGVAMLFAINLIAICLAVYRMISYALAHPPEA
ncbi:MAG: hypothetical protein JSU00_05360 [Acidobacteria bacterium]|nr:hypothetical protein [Acidobacteriota bacterium]